METALVIGAAAVGLYVLWKVAQPAAAPAQVVTPPPAAPLPTSLTGLAVRAITNPNSINHAIFGVGTDSFTTFAEKDALGALKEHMCNCYRGNRAACAAAVEQAPALASSCEPGNCDCNPVQTGPATITYGFKSARGLVANYGPKVPVGGCKPYSAGGYDNTSDRKSNIAGGYCAGLV